MVKENKKIATKTTVFLISILAVLVIAVGIVSANSWLKKTPNAHFSMMAPCGMNNTYMSLIQTAIKNNDYATWKSLMESQLTQENFNKLVNMSKSMNEFKHIGRNISISGNFPHAERFRQGNFTSNFSKRDYHFKLPTTG